MENYHVKNPDSYRAVGDVEYRVKKFRAAEPWNPFRKGEKRKMKHIDHFSLHETRIVEDESVKHAVDKEYIVDKVSLIQSVDSLRLAEEIERRAAKINKVMDILVEVNVGGEESKGGVPVEKLFSLLDAVKTMPHLRLKGLMSVLPAEGEEKLVPLYQKLLDLYDQVKALQGPNFAVEYLSAGMSGDYAVALKNGSNMVRIGSKVFGARHYI